MSRSNDGWLNALVLARVDHLSSTYRRGYLLFALITALAGYGFFILMPFVVVICVALLFQWIPFAAGNVVAWIKIVVVSLIALGSLLTFIRLFQIRFHPTKGLQVSKKQAPNLYAAIAEVREHYKRPAIKNVVVTERPELRIESIPRYGLPIVSTNNLVIGLPLLQTLSAAEFRCDLSRSIGQYSGLSHRITFFVYKMDRLWDLYNRSLSKNRLFGMFFLRWFYNLYAPFFHVVAKPAIRWEEMEADLCALDFINEKEVFEALKSRTISDIFLERCYWPNVQKMILKNTGATAKPFENLENIMPSALNKEGRQKWLEKAYKYEQLPEDDMPSFRQRMEHMGHSKIRSIPVSGSSALDELFGNSRKKVIAIIEKLWSSTIRAQWIKEYKEHCKQIEKLKGLSRKSSKGILWPKEILSYALLEKNLRGKSIKNSVLKILRKNIMNMLPDFITNRVRSTEQANDIF